MKIEDMCVVIKSNSGEIGYYPEEIMGFEVMGARTELRVCHDGVVYTIEVPNERVELIEKKSLLFRGVEFLDE